MPGDKASVFEKEQSIKNLAESDPWSCFETGMMMFTEDIFADGRLPSVESEREEL